MIATAIKSAIIAMFIAVSIMSVPTSAAACDDDTIRSVSGDGSIIIMTSGAVYEVDGADTVDSALWSAADDVLVCNDTIINTDEDGEKVDATRLR